MPNYAAVADSIQHSLGLKFTPIAVILTDTAPEGVKQYEGHAPAGCAFWEEAAAGAFTTSAANHAMCSIGIYTHNLAGAPPQYASELGAVLEVMSGMEYARAEDVAQIPVLSKQPQYAVYAPLAACPAPPDVVLIFADARQGLILAEAAQQVDAELPPALGRPACAAVPQAYNSGRATVSFGCCGARAYVGALDAGTALWALPGAKLDRYAARIAKLAEANDVLTHFHTIRKADVAAGGSPSYADSLQRMCS
jgi:uncharacterized protein (DUF169 family)